MADPPQDYPFWTKTTEEIQQQLDCTLNGLRTAQAEKRQTKGKSPTFFQKAFIGHWGWLGRSWASPLLWLLFVAISLAAILGQTQEAILIGIILIGSTLLTTTQEWRAQKALEKLQQWLVLKTLVLRDQRWQSLPINQLVPGDRIRLHPGDWIPADGIIITSNQLTIVQASLTGEPQPTPKFPGVVAGNASIAERHNVLYMGSSVYGGSADMLVVYTGPNTLWGEISATLQQPRPISEFNRGIKQLGLILLYIVTIMLVVTLAFNQWQKRPLMDGLLFCLALAIGLSPEMLPAIVSITVAKGAMAMSRVGVIVRRLEVMEDLGTMTVLCTDKTGTLTQASMVVHDAIDTHGSSSLDIRQLGWSNAMLQSSSSSALDQVLIQDAQHHQWQPQGLTKIGELGYDFFRQRITIEIQDEKGDRFIITKGAAHKLLDLCTHERTQTHSTAEISTVRRAQINQLCQEQGQQGRRVLALATREKQQSTALSVDDEHHFVLEGFLTFDDPPKPDALHTIRELNNRGVEVKMITGDQASVALQIAQSVGLARGLQASSILCGHHIDLLDDAALCQRAAITPIFAQTEPHHKARIIRALRHSGQIVGYLGDGLNDVPALQAAHVAVSVHNAAQVARQSADVVLTKNDLRVLSRGIDEGRRTFANTRKYLTVTTSANLGNMLSMAIGSILLPFFPMSSGQILLNNLLSDVPALFLSVDRVPSEIIQKSQRWQLTDFVRTILAFGLISSGFDAALFGLLSFTWGVSEAEFQTAWFQFSLLTELITIILLCRSKTRWENLPSAPIVLSCVIVGLLALMMPVCSFTQMTLSFESLRWPYLICVLLLSLAYGVCIESAKTMLHRYSGNNE